MKFITTKRVLIGDRGYLPGDVVDSPRFAMPFFLPLDLEAQKALDMIGVCVDLYTPPEGTKNDSGLTADEEPQAETPKPARRRGTKRQPY